MQTMKLGIRITSNYTIYFIVLFISWYFGQLSRSETNDLLHDQESGTFLVRDSATLKGDFVLCVRYNLKNFHIKNKYFNLALLFIEKVQKQCIIL